MFFVQGVDKRLLFVGGFALVIAQFASLATPYLIKIVVDDAIGANNIRLLWYVAGTGLALYAITSVGRYVGQRAIDIAAEDFHWKIRNTIFGHLQGLSLRFHYQHSVGELMSRVNGDSYYCKNFVQSVIPGLIHLVIGVGGTAIILLFLAPKLFFVALIPIPIVGLLAYIYRHRVQPLSNRSMQASAKLYETLQESLVGIHEIKVYGGEKVFEQRIVDDGKQFRDAAVALATQSAKLFPLLDFAISFVLLAVLVAGGQMVMTEYISVGTLVVAYYYIARSLGPIRGASGIVLGWHSSRAAVKRINELLHSDQQLPVPDNPAKIDDITAPMHWRFEDVVFDYVDDTTQDIFRALDQMSFDIEPGEQIAILGPSGAGKSTTGKLLLRLYDPQQGRITLNGIALPQLALDDTRNKIGYVGQEVFLFNGTMRENILFGLKGDIDPEVLNRVLRLSRVDEILQRKSTTLDAQVGELGIRLSGGQKKRIGLARALVRNPALLIIDQLASDLEEQLNQEIFENIQKERPDIAILYLGHSVPAGFLPHKIYWMEHGKLELREKERRYA